MGKNLNWATADFLDANHVQRQVNVKIADRVHNHCGEMVTFLFQLKYLLIVSEIS